jgi:hypothetical protein
MPHRTKTRLELQTRADRIQGLTGVVGLDGFVDKIVHPVAQRHGQGDQFTPISTIAEFGHRILAASGKSTNIELYPVMEKLGGNGPLMANALISGGLSLRYIGALGKPSVHGILQDFAARSQAVSFAEPGVTIAAEFSDGKIMLGNTVSLDDITYDAMLAAVGSDELKAWIDQAAVVALVNWTMIPNMTALFVALLEKLLPTLPPRKDRVWFFDLADPEKRSQDDLVEALRVIARFEQFGSVTLGLNLKETHQVCVAMALPIHETNESGLRAMARSIRETLGVSTVVVHPKESAACATTSGEAWVPGPYTSKPKITTGAGDHFNAGYVTGQLLGLSPEGCLTTGVCFSGFYVRTGESPTLNDIDAFLRDW